MDQRIVAIGNNGIGGLVECPRCQSPFNGVADSRRTEQGRVVRRRRVCAGCDYRWTTYERWEKHSEPAGKSADLMHRWLNVHDICGMGVRAVEMSK